MTTMLKEVLTLRALIKGALAIFQRKHQKVLTKKKAFEPLVSANMKRVISLWCFSLLSFDAIFHFHFTKKRVNHDANAECDSEKTNLTDCDFRFASRSITWSFDVPQNLSSFYPALQKALSMSHSSLVTNRHSYPRRFTSTLHQNLMWACRSLLTFNETFLILNKPLSTAHMTKLPPTSHNQDLTKRIRDLSLWGN